MHKHLLSLIPEAMDAFKRLEIIHYSDREKKNHVTNDIARRRLFVVCENVKTTLQRSSHPTKSICIRKLSNHSNSNTLIHLKLGLICSIRFESVKSENG